MWASFRGAGHNYPGQTKEDAQKERERLFGIIRELVKWENTNNEEILKIARKEIRKSWSETCEMNKGVAGFDPDKLPAFHDPFAGGGAIPLEAQRLGLESYATDLNPVAVMINKASIEIPSRFSGRAPVGPIIKGDQVDARGIDGWSSTHGLAEDIRRYGYWMKKEAQAKIGHLYPKVLIDEKIVAHRKDLEKYLGRELTVISWIWARTVKSPNPAFSDSHVPLVSSYILSSKKGKEAYVSPEVNQGNYTFNVFAGIPEDIKEAKKGTKTSRGANFKCLLSETPISSDYIKDEGKANRLSAKLMAVVLEGDRERVYLAPSQEMEEIALNVETTWKPNTPLPNDPRNFWVVNYGLDTFGDLFTPRQLSALKTFVDIIKQVKEKVTSDAINSGWANDDVSIESGGSGAKAYGEAVSVYLSFLVGQMANHNSTICGWNSTNAQMRSVFSKQSISMTWDYAESNIFCNSSGSFQNLYERLIKGLFALPANSNGFAKQESALKPTISPSRIISTDPPYYDNIAYADLSDFFYIWFRACLRDIFPDICNSISTPKEEELTALPYRRGGKDNAEQFFLSGMKKALTNIKESSTDSYPVTLYYAFKQSDTTEDGTTSAGWVTFLEAIIGAGFIISGTWPLRSERRGRMISIGTNALASSIVLVCEKRDQEAISISRREFLRELTDELPDALDAMIGGKEGASPIAPVDLAQAAIGPGMAVFSRYSGILEADGSKVSVHDALVLINKSIDEYFSEAEGEMDSDTRFCIDWFQTYGFTQAEFGQADVLARAKGTTVDGLAYAGVLESGGGKVRLFRYSEYPEDWNPLKDNRLPVWEALHQLIRALREGGESEAGKLLGLMADRMEPIRQLAYRLYTLCERKGWAEEARAYNELIASWHGTVTASEQSKVSEPQQLTLDISN